MDKTVDWNTAARFIAECYGQRAVASVAVLGAGTPALPMTNLWGDEDV